jgi:Leucine-rich repeat (LRR) protein
MRLPVLQLFKRLLLLIGLGVLCIIPLMAQDTPAAEALRRIEVARVNAATELNLSNLGLTALPAEIGQLTNLQILHLANNQLTSLPPEMSQLSNLQVLELEGNPLTMPPADVQQEGIDAMLDYLRNYEAMQMQQTLVGVLAGAGSVAVLLLGLVVWQRRRSMQKRKMA